MIIRQPRADRRGSGVALLACIVNPPREQRIQDEMQPFIGQPLTADLQASGDTPNGIYDTAHGRRHCVFERSRFVAALGVYAGTLPASARSRRSRTERAAHRTRSKSLASRQSAPAEDGAIIRRLEILRAEVYTSTVDGHWTDRHHFGRRRPAYHEQRSRFVVF